MLMDNVLKVDISMVYFSLHPIQMASVSKWLCKNVSGKIAKLNGPRSMSWVLLLLPVVLYLMHQTLEATKIVILSCVSFFFPFITFLWPTYYSSLLGI